MSRRLGVSIGAATVHAVLVERSTIQWAGDAAHAGAADIAEVVAHLAAECGRPVRRVRVVFERDLAQCRTVAPAPRLTPRAAARYVALEAPRLFRNGAGPLVTDAALVAVGRHQRVLWAAAGPELVARAVAEGCIQAGLALEALGVAAEVLPAGVSGLPRGGVVNVPCDGASEVLDIVGQQTWRSRLLREAPEKPPAWVAPLAALGADAARFAAAYGAAVAKPRLLLLPPAMRAAAALRARRRLLRLAAAALATWLLAAGTYGARMAVRDRQVGVELARLKPGVDSALSLRRDLAAATAATATLEDASRTRSRSLDLLAALTAGLGDSTVIVAFRVAPDSTVRLSGYAPAAARVLADLERVPVLQAAKLDGPSSREMLGAAPGTARMWDRFAITARLRGSK